MPVKKRTAARRTTPKNTPARRRRSPAAKSTRRVVRKRPAKKGMLSEMLNPKMAAGSVKAMASGAMGGFAGITILKLFPNQTPTTQALILGGASFLSASMLKAPNLAAGMSAIAVYRLMENAGMLADDFALAQFADPIEQLPMVLDENGEDMYLSANDAFALSEYQTGYAPAFGG